MPQTYERQLTAQLAENIQSLASELEATSSDKWESTMLRFSVENSASISVLDEKGVVLINVSTYTNELISGSTSGTESASIASTFENGGNHYAIVSQINANATESISGIFSKVFPYVLVAIILISALTAFFYSRYLARPIVGISNISKKMTALNMSWRCDVSRSDEIGVLAVNLNEMAVRLDNALCELQTANEKLQEDIEKGREQDKRRRDFFSAISHELKTPVTILKGELDGMILNVGKFKDRDKYLQEAYETTQSIEALVREILTLAKLDTLSLTFEETPLSDLADECCRIYGTLAQKKLIQINRKYDENIVIQADKNQMQTVISNVIGNAVKHSPEGSIVDISLSQKDSEVILTVENSGVHIDKSELAQTWEPFYRTDKSRSRDTGGSGLGLYIVKSILDMHGFEYGIENTDSGVLFTIKF